MALQIQVDFKSLCVQESQIRMKLSFNRSVLVDIEHSHISLVCKSCIGYN